MGNRTKDFLSSLGFKFNMTPQKLDKLFYRSLDAQGKGSFDAYVESRLYGNAETKRIFQIPKTVKQAALLFSHDGERSVSSLRWLAGVLKTENPGTILDLGCGAGFTIQYLSQNFPEFKFEGLEANANLVSIAEELTNSTVWQMNYLCERPAGCYDYLICEFGWDPEDIFVGLSPHDEDGNIDGHQYCMGCSRAAQASFTKMLQSWSSLMSDNGKILLTGRLAHMGHLIALLEAANKVGLQPENSSNQWIYWRAQGEKQRAPALVLSRNRNRNLTEVELEGEAAMIFRASSV